jgi:hypothetical protein
MGALSRLHRRATLEPRGWCTNWTVLETCPLVDGRVCSTLAVATRSFDATDTGSAGTDDRLDRFQQRTTSCRQTEAVLVRRSGSDRTWAHPDRQRSPIALRSLPGRPPQAGSLASTRGSADAAVAAPTANTSPAATATTSASKAAWDRVRPLTATAAAGLRPLPTRQVVAEDRPRPARELMPTPRASNHVGPRRPCHSRATSDGQPWYRADNYGHMHPQGSVIVL